MKTTLKIVRGNKRYNFDVTLQIDENRILFKTQPFSKILNAEIKSMKGYKWHGFDDPPLKKWSIENHPRNVIQLRRLMGENVYEWFERPLMQLTKEDFNRPEYSLYGVEINGAQIDMVNRSLTYHYQILAAEQGIGKSLAYIEVMERSGKNNWWYVGPKSALASVEYELVKWDISNDIRLSTFTYEGLVSKMRYDFDGLEAPDGIIFDEADGFKNPTTHRAIAAQAIADLIREQHGMEGYVIEGGGTPAAKNPSDWWSQCEIAWPGYLREGSFRAFEQRYAITEQMQDLDGVTFNKRIGWNEEEVAKLPSRYEGLATVYRKAEWLPDLPPKQYETVRLEASNKVLRVARSLTHVAPNTITALTWLRALSSGFQYVNTRIEDKVCNVCKGTGEYEFPEDSTCPGCGGTGKQPEYERQTRQVQTPKDDALRKDLDQCETHGRIVIAASFQGSIDRIRKICKERGWAVACVDGRGWRCYDSMGNSIDDKVLFFWGNHPAKVAFVGNPRSCRTGLTLTLAYTLIFYDNNFSAVDRLQMEDRIHRLTMDMVRGAIIKDYIHLEVDQLVVDTLKENKKLELLSLGVINETVGLDANAEVGEEILL